MTASVPVEDKASKLDMRRAIARKIRRSGHEAQINYLNITPMLDMMTIILVFLLKSLSSTPTNIPQDENLKIPQSSAVTDPSGALQVIISRVSITVNGKNLGISLRSGLVDPSIKRGGSSSFLINPLNNEMRDQAEHARQLAAMTHLPFKGELAVIADADTPSRTIYEVLYTCGQNGFGTYNLIVLKSGGQ